jgi:5-methyltetrahydrofolate--homocysteine methyltransferase
MEDLFRERILAGDREGIKALTDKAVRESLPVAKIISQYLMPPMDEVGRRYEAGELFIPEMLMSARAMQAGMAVLKPLIVGAGIKTMGRVVIGTVEGDLHDIGKTLVGMMLEGAGFEVHDLGVDVKADRFVEAARDLKASIVAMSALLTTTMPNMKAAIEALNQAGLRDGLIVMVGGAPLTAEYAASIGADGYAEDAASAVRRARQLVADVK